MQNKKIMDKLVLIDGNSLINRAFYATQPFSTKDGVYTNAVFGFVKMYIKIINDIKPKYVVVAFDRHEPTFRHKMFSDYKGTRRPMPEELPPQIDLLKKVLDSMNVCRYEQAGIEADDIIGALSKKFQKETVIITGDKDSFQLVDDTTSVYFTLKGISELDVYNNKNFKEKTGILPYQVIEKKALMGDSSDNIPGISGIGEKTAVDLLQRYENIDNLFSHTDQLTGKLKEKIENGKDVAYLSKTLATIDTTVDIPITLKDAEFYFPFPAETKKLFTLLEFKSLLKDDLFTEDAKHLSTDTKSPEKLVINSENFSLDGISVKSLYIGKSVNFYDGNKEYELKVRENLLDLGFDVNSALKIVSPLFNYSEKLVVYSKKELKKFLDSLGYEFSTEVDDVSIEKYVVNPSGKEETVEDICFDFSLPENCPAYSLYQAHLSLEKKIEEYHAEKLYKDVELPLSDVLFDMEKNGFKIDIQTLDEMEKGYNSQLSVLLKQIYETAGEEFNINSPKQLSTVLFDKLGLQAGKKNKSGLSTSAEILEKLSDAHPIVPLILKYRQIQKLNSTYVKGFKSVVDKKTGLIHTCFNQTLTTTGRLSSKEPNLQNIPVREQEGKEIRKLFVSSFVNGKLVGADYSQIELRLLAHFSKCQPLIDAFLHGGDIHSLTASQVFKVDLKDVDSDMRRSAKAVNFGIIYGISNYGLSEQLKISPKQASDYIKTYFEMYPSVKEYMDENVKFAHENGYSTTLFNRRRYFRDINSSNFNLRSFNERAAMNMPLQGTAADIIKIAMINVYNRIKKEGLKAKLILQVHDELIVDTPDNEVEKVKTILIEEMQNAVSLSVPLTVETECGARWFDAK